MTVEFGRARSDELTTVEKLLAENDWGVRTYDSGEWFVARDDRAILSVVHVTDLDGNARYFDDVVTMGEWRGRGIGAQLMHFVMEDREATFYLVCHEPRIPFYERLGFQLIEESEVPEEVREHAYATDDLPSSPDHVHLVMRRQA